VLALYKGGIVKNVARVIIVAVSLFISSALFIGCSSPDKVVDDPLKTGGDVAKGVVDGTGTVVKGVAGGTGTVAKGVADTTGAVVEGAAGTAGEAVAGVTTGETADGIGRTIDGAGKEFFRKRDVDIAGQDVQVDMSSNKKVKIEF